MQLSDDIKAKIQAEYDSWRDKLWAGKAAKDNPKEMMLRFKDWIMKLLDDNVFKTLWHKDRRAALLYVVQDAEMAEFLNTHLSDKVIESISG